MENQAGDTPDELLILPPKDCGESESQYTKQIQPTTAVH